MAWGIRSAAPPLNRASLGTGRCAACRHGPAPGSRAWRSGERTRARGHTVHPSTPREVARAKAAERPAPQWSVGRRGRAVGGPSTGQRPTGAAGAAPAVAAPAGGTRSAPGVVGPADATGRTAGPGPGGQGGGRPRRPSGPRRARPLTRAGAIPPERVLTARRSRRQRRQTGAGQHGPHGRGSSDPARPWRSADRRGPGRRATGGAAGHGGPPPRRGPSWAMTAGRSHPGKPPRAGASRSRRPAGRHGLWASRRDVTG